MVKSTVFMTSKGQVVRLPKSVALADTLEQVEIARIGRSRLISPVQHSWDAFFDAGGTGDFLNRKQPKPKKCKPL
jgi:antitoxin VapB